MNNNSIYKILEIAIELKASDIHLTNNTKPVLRVDGELMTIDEFDINNPEILNFFTREVLKDKEMMNIYINQKQIDSSLEYNGTRFRNHIYRQRECDTFSLRLIPKEIPLFSTMNLPLVLRKFSDIKNGLILITGTTGSGKSTTLASIIGEINKNYKKHIITIEDPIEFVHDNKLSIINQREVGVDVLCFSDAVKAAMREDPDILLVGEMRELETITNAITMAETGHLVFATLHTKSVAESVDRIVDVFPAMQQEQIRIQLANSLQGVVSQELLPKVGGGRVPCCEIMIVNDAIRSMIREHSSPNSILDAVETANKKNGSQTKIQALAKLINQDLITRETADKITDSTKKEELNRLISLMK